jgi:hypothetical protein
LNKREKKRQREGDGKPGREREEEKREWGFSPLVHTFV